MPPAVNPTSAPPAAASVPLKRKRIGPTPEEMQQQAAPQAPRSSAPATMPSPMLSAPPGLQAAGRQVLASVPTAPASSAPPAAQGSAINPTWQTYFNSRVTQLGPNATPQQLQALEAEADGKFARYADANAVAQASPQVMNQSNAAAAGAMQQNDAMRGRTVPQTPLLTPRPATSAPPAAAAPMFPPNAAAAGMANAINDANNNITSRGGGVVSTAQGGYIQTSPGGVKTVSSPYGRTGTGAGSAGYSVDTGKMGPGDANLRAQTNAMKTRQAQGVFSPAPPAVAAAPAPMAPKPAAAPLTAAAPPLARPSNTRPGVPVSSSLNATPAGSTAAGVMSSTPQAASPVARTAPSPSVGASPAPAMARARTISGGAPVTPTAPAPAPVTSSAPPRATGSAPPGGWMNLAKNNFNQSMAGEIVDMTTNKAKKVASSVGGAVKSGYAAAGRAVKSGYAAAGRAVMPVVQPVINQAKTNLAASSLGKALGVAPPVPLTALR